MGWCITIFPDRDHWNYHRLSKGCRLLYFIESLHETSVNRTYTKCESDKTTDDAKCKMELMKEVILQTTDDLPSSNAEALHSLKRHVLRLYLRQEQHFKLDNVIPRGHSFVAAMVLGL